jgi:hypothetical protein
MDENVSKSPDRGENAANKVAPFAASESAPESQASDSKLRVLWCDSKLRDLWSPKLNLGEGVADDCARAVAGERITASSADTAQGASGEAVARPASDAPLPRSLRLAAPVAAAAVLGAFVGSLSTGGVARFWPGIASNVVASGGTQAIKAELAELSALKTNLEGATRNLPSMYWSRRSSRGLTDSSGVLLNWACRPRCVRRRPLNGRRKTMFRPLPPQYPN